MIGKKTETDFDKWIKVNLQTENVYPHTIYEHNNKSFIKTNKRKKNEKTYKMVNLIEWKNA